jgi:hypothetical protein
MEIGKSEVNKTSEQILRRRMHGLYISRQCGEITQLSRELLGLHCWFHRNVVFSALIRGADITGWKTALTKTWLYRGTLHGVDFEDLPLLLALHPGETYLSNYLGEQKIRDIAGEVVRLMEDGVYSRAEMRRIFADRYDGQTIEVVFSSWGGIFVYLARLGKVAFRDMKSRDFDLISAEPSQTPDEVLPELLRRYFTAYGPATLTDAAWFLGLWKDGKKRLAALNLDEFTQLEYDRDTYYYIDDGAETGDIPELTLLAGFDPIIVSYTERRAILPPEYKSAVILKSGICNPTIAVNGQVAGLWNIKKNEPVVTFFAAQPKRIQNAAFDLVDDMRRRTSGVI